MTLEMIKIAVPEGHDQGFHESRLIHYLSPLFAEVGAEEELYDLALARDRGETSEGHGLNIAIYDEARHSLTWG